MSKAKELRNLIQRDGMTIAPGAYDCITAALIAHAGFAAVYMTGAGTAASHGYPDYGLLTMSEMVGNASRIAATALLSEGILRRTQSRISRRFPSRPTFCIS